MVVKVTQKHINDALAYKGNDISRNCPVARALKDRGFDPEVGVDIVCPFAYMKGVSGSQREKEYLLPENATEFIAEFDTDDRDLTKLKPFKFTLKNLKPIDVTTGPRKVGSVKKAAA